MDDFQVDVMVENSYDSELEAEFFGTKDPDANDKVFGELEKAMAQKEKEAEEKKALAASTSSSQYPYNQPLNFK